MTQRATQAAVRWLTVAALAGAVLVVTVVILGGGNSAYTLNIRFVDAGQLVTGDRVEVAGIPIGTISSMSLTDDGQAQVTVQITSGRFTPFHQGTTASIGTVGLSGVTNRFVALAPGPRMAPTIPDGGILPSTATTPIVDIDAVLDSITPPVRRDLRGWIQSSAHVLHGNVPAARATLRYATTALQRTGELASQLTADRLAFSRLLSSGATTAATLAGRQGQLTSAVSDTASALGAVARARISLADSLIRAPSVLRQGARLLRALRPTLAVIDPVLRDAQPVAVPLAQLLRTLVPVTQAASPVLTRFDAVLPVLGQALRRLPALSRSGIPALTETTTALDRALPIFAGLRPYGEDILLGFLHGYGGGSSENYDANGQFSRIALGLPLPTLLTSELGFDIHQLAPHFLTGQTNKCPGSAAQPAPDRSNHVVVPSCDPSQVP